MEGRSLHFFKVMQNRRKSLNETKDNDMIKMEIYREGKEKLKNKKDRRNIMLHDSRSFSAVLKKVGITIGIIFGILFVIARIKKKSSIYEDEKDQKNPMEGKKVLFIENPEEQENADGVHGHLEAIGIAEGKRSFYDRFWKRVADIILSFCGLIILSPVYLIILLIIIIDDPGPVLFTQKRIGLNKAYFKLHKFRSMKMNTPHDRPTHMLENPEQYITRVGRFIRAHSLDELPQIWDIFIGNMSVIGPRPALWNQDLLIAYRDEYGANDVKPGLTGWAQINGRDELEIPEKAKLDGIYAAELKKNVLEALKMDIKCFFGSIKVFVGDKSIVEGGSRKMRKSQMEK